MSSSSTFSGTIVSIAGSITAANLITRLSRTLAGHDWKTDRWNETTLLAWINEAIADYSTRFPREVTDTLTTTAAQTYDLPANFQTILSVQYPTADDPPIYLIQRPHTHPSFNTSNNHYDILPTRDHQNPSQIQISATPTSGQTITIRYNASHDNTLTPASTLTVPPEHHDMLFMYGLWQAWLARRETAVTELRADKISNTEFKNIQGKVYGARLDYYAVLSQGKRHIKGQSALIQWQDDGNGRIY